MFTEEEKKKLEEAGKRPVSKDEKKLLDNVEESRITLVDNQDHEHEYMILGEYQVEEKKYLALVSVDKNDDTGDGVEDAGEMNDITVVRKIDQGEDFILQAVNDSAELLAVSRLLEKDYGQLLEKKKA
jgi:hypothetical protein